LIPSARFPWRPATQVDRRGRRHAGDLWRRPPRSRQPRFAISVMVKITYIDAAGAARTVEGEVGSTVM
jgi:hypothetical protein